MSCPFPARARRLALQENAAAADIMFSAETLSLIDVALHEGYVVFGGSSAAR